ncbi:hypothetical protein B0H14DRAFT_2615573 [Mycena olivaceomarginata]|nr:hypothetical protein B0H14DRAFT_2615573 [Mycena olivaceomarginata]
MSSPHSRSCSHHTRSPPCPPPDDGAAHPPRPRRPHCIALPEQYRAFSVQLRLRADWYRVDGGGASTGKEQGSNSWAPLAWWGMAGCRASHCATAIGACTITISMSSAGRGAQFGGEVVEGAGVRAWRGRAQAPRRLPPLVVWVPRRERPGSLDSDADIFLKSRNRFPGVEEPWAGTDMGRCILWSIYSPIPSAILLAPVAARLPPLRVCKLVRLAVPVFHCDYKYEREPYGYALLSWLHLSRLSDRAADGWGQTCVPSPASPRLGMRTRTSPLAGPAPGLGSASLAAAVAGPGTTAVRGDGHRDGSAQFPSGGVSIRERCTRYICIWTREQSSYRHQRARKSEISKLNAAEQLHQLQDAFNRQKEEIEALKKAAAEAARKNAKTSRKQNLIPKPKGQAGKNFTIQDEMGLRHNAERYNRLYRIVKDYTHEYLLVHKTISQQNRMRLDEAIAIIGKEFKYFGKFEGFWPTRRNNDSALEKKAEASDRAGATITELEAATVDSDEDEEYLDTNNAEPLTTEAESSAL